MHKIHIDGKDKSFVLISLANEDGENSQVLEEITCGSREIASVLSRFLLIYALSPKNVAASFFKGPGSFTGLRISSAISNVINWNRTGSLTNVEYPEYGSEARITPRKGN